VAFVLFLFLKKLHFFTLQYLLRLFTLYQVRVPQFGKPCRKV